MPGREKGAGAAYSAGHRGSLEAVSQSAAAAALATPAAVALGSPAVSSTGLCSAAAGDDKDKDKDKGGLDDDGSGPLGTFSNRRRRRLLRHRDALLSARRRHTAPVRSNGGSFLSTVRSALRYWTEATAVAEATPSYCDFTKMLRDSDSLDGAHIPPVKSTISIAFSSCGRYFASTHGDHTVKVTDFERG